MIDTESGSKVTLEQLKNAKGKPKGIKFGICGSLSSNDQTNYHNMERKQTDATFHQREPISRVHPRGADPYYDHNILQFYRDAI